MYQQKYLAPPLSDLPFETDCFLEQFEAFVAKSLSSLDDPVLDLAKHVMLSGGKRIRPMLCYFCGVRNRQVTQELLKAGTILELVHVSTLVHDDLIDNSNLRRGTETIHSFAGEHTAVLLGDALFSFALELATEFPSNRVCRIVSKATRLTCSGEIKQTSARGDFSISLGEYLNFINLKTGELFKASCQLGALLGGRSDDDFRMVGRFGLSLGLCYQIYDDLLDAFGDLNSSGKTLGRDLDSGKVTLPLLLLFEKLNSSQKERLRLSLSNAGSFDQGSLAKLYLEHDILGDSIKALQSEFDGIYDILEGLSDPSLRSNLYGFLSFFSDKLAKLENLRVGNFLASTC